VTALLVLGVVAMAGYFYWVVVTALMRGRTPDFGRDIYRSEQPRKFWVQVILCFWMAVGATIYALFLIGDLTGQ
jgi:hypothetical protein